MVDKLKIDTWWGGSVDALVYPTTPSVEFCLYVCPSVAWNVFLFVEYIPEQGLLNVKFDKLFFM